MNIDIKKGCFYRIYVDFGKDDKNYISIVAEGLNLKQMEETIIEKIEDQLYSVARYARDNGHGTIVPLRASIEPRYYYFIQKEDSDERYPVNRTSVSMYEEYRTKKPGPHFYIPTNEISWRHSFDSYNIPCEDRDKFDDVYFTKLFEKVNEQLKDKFNEYLQELYVTDKEKMASVIKDALNRYDIPEEIRAELNATIEKLQ